MAGMLREAFVADAELEPRPGLVQADCLPQIMEAPKLCRARKRYLAGIARFSVEGSASAKERACQTA